MTGVEKLFGSFHPVLSQEGMEYFPTSLLKICIRIVGAEIKRISDLLDGDILIIMLADKTQVPSVLSGRIFSSADDPARLRCCRRYICYLPGAQSDGPGKV